MSVAKHSFTRRAILKTAAIAVAAGAVFAGTPAASAQTQSLGTILDYSGGVPSAQSVKDAGHVGAIRYVSEARPGAEWMIGKPVSITETTDFANHGLYTASVYQFGKGETSDWKRGAAGAAVHSPQAIALHKAAGGPTGVPIYVAIDDNPTREQYTNQIRPYLEAFERDLNAAGYQMGIYGNYATLDWAVADDLGEYFWQHEWGSNGRVHPQADLHQVRIDKDSVGGVTVDINNIYSSDWGQWTPGVAGGGSDIGSGSGALTTPGTNNPGAGTNTGTGTGINPNSSVPLPGGSSVNAGQIQQGLNLVQQLSNALN